MRKNPPKETNGREEVRWLMKEMTQRIKPSIEGKNANLCQTAEFYETKIKRF